MTNCPQYTGATLEDQIKVMAELMMRRQLLVKADRKFKKPRPGMKRRAKWPKKLIHVPDQVRAGKWIMIIPADIFKLTY